MPQSGAERPAAASNAGKAFLPQQHLTAWILPGWRGAEGRMARRRTVRGRCRASPLRHAARGTSGSFRKATQRKRIALEGPAHESNIKLLLHDWQKQFLYPQTPSARRSGQIRQGYRAGFLVRDDPVNGNVVRLAVEVIDELKAIAQRDQLVVGVRGEIAVVEAAAVADAVPLGICLLYTSRCV